MAEEEKDIEKKSESKENTKKKNSTNKTNKKKENTKKKSNNKSLENKKSNKKKSSTKSKKTESANNKEKNKKKSDTNKDENKKIVKKNSEEENNKQEEKHNEEENKKVEKVEKEDNETKKIDVEKNDDEKKKDEEKKVEEETEQIFKEKEESLEKTKGEIDKEGKHIKDDSVKTKKELRQERLNKQRRHKKRIKRLKIIAACIIGVYALGVALFSFLCYPNTIVADTNLSFRTEDGMKQALIPNAGEYEFNVEGFGFNLNIPADQINYNFNIDEVVSKVLRLKNPIAWPVEIFVVHDFMSESVVSFNKEAATSIVVPAVAAHNDHSSPSLNADFVCDNETKTVDVKDEVIGDTLKPEETLTSILAYIGSGRRHLELGDNEHQLPTLYADDERIPDAIEKANLLLKSSMSLMMSTTNVATVDYTMLSTWVHLREGYVAGLNDEIVTAWIATLADQCDTVGKSRTYTTPYGKTVTVSGGDEIGWAIDKEGLFDVISKQAPKGEIASVNVPCSSTLGGYAGPGGRDWGPRYIDVDLSQQHARMYDDAGSLVWEADIVSGKPSTPTFTGIYTVKVKASPSTLIGSPDPTTGQPSYRTTVQYWMGFEGNAIGFHDATWQPGFGGDLWRTIGSHGCVNLSYSSAQRLYSLCESGDIVVVHN